MYISVPEVPSNHAMFFFFFFSFFCYQEKLDTMSQSALEDVISPDLLATTRIPSSQPGQHVDYVFRLKPDSDSLDLSLVPSSRPVSIERLGITPEGSPASRR